MSDQASSTVASTTDSVRATTASRDGGGGTPAERPGSVRILCKGEGARFTVGPEVERSAGARPYERGPDAPLYRPLRIYTVDPGTRRDEGATAVVNVPYEPLEDGLKGYVFHVMPVKKHPGTDVAGEINIDLNDPFLLLTSGRTPSPVDPGFHQQMVYAVASLVYASFRRALGRHVGWGFGPHEGDGGHTRLRLSPHGLQARGANYNRERGEVRFGFFRTQGKVKGRAVEGGLTFSCVSHDIVTHEVTHALLDGLRAHFLDPTSADVLGFHEGFADVIALLHRFSYTEVLRAAVRSSQGKLLRSAVITSIAMEFGLAAGHGGALRSLLDTRSRAKAKAKAAAESARATGVDEPSAAGETSATEDEESVFPQYSPELGGHAMGEVFASAVFHAFATVYERKTERYLRLATGGTGVLPSGDISTDLQDVLVEEASQLASQFLNVCIRALDYCPPVDLRLGEFLRAVITADLDLVPDDPWGYRESWIEAFALHGIFPPNVQCMSEDELKWDFVPPEELVVKKLSFTRLEFDGDPACVASPHELRRRACALGRFIAKHPERFGIVPAGHPDLDGDDVSVPEVHSVRSSRRVGPDGQVVFDLVAEVTQERWVRAHQLVFRGGSTVILGPRGEVRYVIHKHVAQNDRVHDQKEFMKGAGAGHVATLENGWRVSDAGKVQFSHQHD